MTNAFSELLASRDWLLTDGATGTNLFAMGLEAGESPETWNLTERAKIAALYQGSVDAGSDLFLTNSFGGNAARLKLHDLQDRVGEINRIAAEIGREVADASNRKIIVAGSVGPTGEIMEPVGALSHAEAVEMFEEQGRALLDGGADVLWLETISAPEEYKAAAEAFANLDAPWVGTMSFDTAGRTMMGVTSPAMVALVESLPNAPLAFGANCGTGAADILRTVLGFAATGTTRPIISKGNAGIPKYMDGHIHYNGTPELMADYAEMARNCGARIIGGCCGTQPEHLRHMRDALETRPRAEAPSLEAIVAALGAFTSADDGSTGPTEGGRERSRRRR
ncbi:betaine--homocysteine S-methyltransferase [Abyssibius alkaniclasticus]|uniref:betaine--homocysteine S-methyltransferase n=1 Tax=Abyssibius alkaniclasticus TaxID=2881234 RepID=UPI004059266C